MKKSNFVYLLMAIPLLVAACTGRPQATSNSLPVAVYGLKPGQPAVVAFSANWCHPCREEIETLNRASAEFSGQLQIVGFLVEGEQKGGAVESGDVGNFKSFGGVAPEYPISTDTSWKLFDASRAPQGHALPTLLIIDRFGKTQQIVQQSLDYTTQLRPLILALLQGETPAPVDTEPKPAPVTPGQQNLTDSVGNWLARAEVVVRPELRANLTAAWEVGIAKNGVPKLEMPIESGKIAFSWDGANSNTPQNASWFADTPTSVCSLKIVLDANANLVSQSGVCRPK